MNATDLTPVQILALKNIIKSADYNKASDLVEPGDYSVDLNLNLTATVKKSEDEEKVVAMKIDTWAILAAALSKLNGVTLDSLITEARNADPAMVKDVKSRATDAIKAIKSDAVAVTRGKVTVKGGVEAI